MLSLLGKWLGPHWGPLRLLNSHLMLIASGTLFAGLLVWSRLPRLWHLLPHDQGKSLAADGGQKSKGKPTGAGLWISLLILPVILLVVPPSLTFWGILVALYLAMFFGYLDDASEKPWGELKKGLIDAAIALFAAWCLSQGKPVTLWWPFVKTATLVSPWYYIPGAAALLWFTMNATNCSDGVDGLAGSLTLISLFSLAALLYGVVGYAPIADYLLIPHYPDSTRWAILTATIAGGLAGYLWHNAEPSRVLMGDAGSRMLGLLVGVAVLMAGNPFLVIVVAPVVLVNGGTGMLKLILLRLLKRIGFDTTHPSQLSPAAAARQNALVRTLHRYRFPLHDHCRKNMKWKNSEVLLRFVLVQAFLTPALFVILIKIR